MYKRQTGNNSLLRAGNDSATIIFGGLSLPRQTLLAYDELGTFVITGAEDGSPATSSPKEITYLHKTTQTIPLEICTIEASGSESDSPVTNNCSFNLNTPTSGTTKLKVFAHFVNTSLPASEQALPVTIVNRDITIGTNAAAVGQSVTIPYQKNAAGGYDTQTFLILTSYNGTNNQVDITAVSYTHLTLPTKRIV